MMSAAQVTSPPSPGTEPTDLTGTLLRYLNFAFKLGKDQSDRSRPSGARERSVL